MSAAVASVGVVPSPPTPSSPPVLPSQPALPSQPVLPGTPGLTWRGLSSADFGPWHDLVARIQDHDEEHERARMADLEALTQQSWVDMGADCLAAIGADGIFRAVGRNAFRPGATEVLAVALVGGVDPEWRGRGLGRALLAWQRNRAMQNIADLRASSAAAAGLPGRVGAYVEDHVTARARLLRADGFQATRWFSELRRPLGAGIHRPPPLPATGLRVEPFTDAVVERTRMAHNDAFADHWGSVPHTPESWHSNLVGDEAFRPGLSYVVVATTEPGEPVVAYVLNCEYAHDWPAQGFSEGYTELLGVRREYRGRGLATHLLELTAHAVAAHGHPYNGLGVDTGNPTGAFALYRRLGYEQVHSSTYFSVEA